ncbi:Uncharacterised protein [Actinomyces viscosus]|uniref:Uncharacterized protein n=1 Tax=Actinomyces viscosus TaxID=1656 RepID=A0A448PMC8_ACTVI|nr:Uncharacterised protein [Actinomyces viscosus]
MHCAQVSWIRGHDGVSLFLSHEDDVDVNDVPMTGSSAQQADSPCCHLIEWHDPHAGIRQQSRDPSLPRTAPPGLFHNPGGHAQRQVGLQSPPKEGANSGVPAFKGK